MLDINAAPEPTKPDTAHYQRVLADVVDLAAAVVQKLAACARIVRKVSDAISRQKLPAETAETLRVEFVERLDAPDLTLELDR